MTTIDYNGRNVGLGYVQGTKNTTMPFAIDPTTHELLVEIIPVSSPLSDLDATRMRIDQNTKNTAGGVSNSDGVTIIPITCDVIVTVPCVRVELT